MLKHETSVSFSYPDLTTSLLVVKATSTTLVTKHAIWVRRLESDGSYLLVPRADGKGYVIRASCDIEFRTWITGLTASGTMMLDDYCLLATDDVPVEKPVTADGGVSPSEEEEECVPKIVDIAADKQSGHTSVLTRTN